MSLKQKSTISTKPQVQDVASWITAPTEPAVPPTSQHVNMLTNKQVDNQTNQQEDTEIGDLPEPTAMLSARVPVKLIRQLRIRAATQGQPIQEIITELLRDYLNSE